MKSFLQRNVMPLAIVTCFSFATIFVLATLLFGTKEFQTQMLDRVDRQSVEYRDLPGRHDAISDRSKKELEVLLQKNPSITGGWIMKLAFEKNENPIIAYSSNHKAIDAAMQHIFKQQTSGKGMSSNEIIAANPRFVSKEIADARTGLIKCRSLDVDKLGIKTMLEKAGKGMCYATIPPYDENVRMAIVVIVDVDTTANTPEIREVRRTLLQLQIDIFNRDFQGRETWAYP